MFIFACLKIGDMSKKKKKAKSKVSFQQVLEHFKSENYQRAADALRSANLSPDESGLAKQLKIEISNQLALRNFAERDYKKAIQYAESNRDMQPKPGFPLSFDKADVIAGLSHLYTGNFKKASEYLKKSENTPETSGFYFYYVLSELYQKKFTGNGSIESFNKQFTNYFTELPTDKKLYLQSIFYLQNSDFENSHEILKKIKAGSYIQKKNLNFLKDYLLGKKYTESKENIKPLYKILANLELSTSEMSYLQNFDVLNNAINLQKDKEQDEALKNILYQLCYNAKPLPKRQLKGLQKNTQYADAYKYILYNQLVALFEDKTKDNFIAISELVYEHWETLFKVPESMPLYQNLLKAFGNEGAYDYMMYLETYLVHNRKLLSDYQIEFIVLRTLLGFDFFNGDMYDEEVDAAAFFELKDWFENSVIFNVFKFRYWLENNKKGECNKIFKEILSNPRLTYFRNYIIEVFEHIFNYNKVNTFYFDEFLGTQFRKNKGGETKHKNAIKYFVGLFSKEYKLTKKSKLLLDLFVALNKHIIEIQSKNNVITNEKLKKYTEKFEEYISFFRESANDTIYSKSLQLLKDELNKGKFAALIEAGNVPELVEIFKTYQQNNNEGAFFKNYFKTGETDSYFNFISNDAVYTLFEVIYNAKCDLHEYDITFIESMMYDANMYTDMDGFLTYILKRYNKKDKIIVEKLTRDYIVKVFDNDYNYEIHKVVETYIKFIVTEIENDKNFKYDKEAIEKSILYLEGIALDKKLKGILKTYLESVEYFHEIPTPHYYDEVKLIAPLLKNISRGDFEYLIRNYHRNNKLDKLIEFVIYLVKRGKTMKSVHLMLYCLYTHDAAETDKISKMFIDVANRKQIHEFIKFLKAKMHKQEAVSVFKIINSFVKNEKQANLFIIEVFFEYILLLQGKKVSFDIDKRVINKAMNRIEEEIKKGNLKYQHIHSSMCKAFSFLQKTRKKY